MFNFECDRDTYLEASLRQTLGALTLEVDLRLTSSWTVLFGPSGAGKTSLLRLLAGLTPLNSRFLVPRRFHRSADTGSGSILFRGRVLMDSSQKIWIPPAERRIGFVTQRPALFPHMTVAENVGFGLNGPMKGERRRRVEEMLVLFSAESLAGRRPAALSGGEKQRVALARALAPEPELVLLDEPFTGLDGELKDAILDNLIEWLGRRGIPALYVSHDVAEVFQTGAEVIVLGQGRIVAQGRPEDVLDQERQRLLRRLEQPADSPYDTQTGSIAR